MKKDLADLVLREEQGDAYLLDLYRSRGAAADGGQERLDHVAAGVQEARAVAILFNALRDAVLDLRKENGDLRSRLSKLEPKPAKARKAVA